MVDSFVVRAGTPLHGTVRVSGATKNSGTKQMAAALLAPDTRTVPCSGVPARTTKESTMGYSTKLSGRSSSNSGVVSRRHTGNGATMPGNWRSPSETTG